MEKKTKEAMPELSPAPSASRRVASSGLAVAAVVGLMAWVSLGGGFGALSTLFGGDSLTVDEQEERAARWRSVPSHSLPPVRWDVEEEREAATRLVESPDVSGQVRYLWLTLWDDRAEDGDIVVISTPGGQQITVPLFHAPTSVPVMVPQGPSVVHVSAVKDGGGYVTVAMASGGGQIPLPAMPEGTTVSVPVY